MNTLMIPAEERNLRVNTVDQAISCASRGDVAGNAPAVPTDMSWLAR